MLGYIGSGTPVLTAQRQALGDTQKKQNNRRRPPDRSKGWQNSHQSGRETHHCDRNQKSIFSPNQVSYSPKDERSKRSDNETHAKREEAGQQCRYRIAWWKE